jgi:hypothetical protein
MSLPLPLQPYPFVAQLVVINVMSNSAVATLIIVSNFVSFFIFAIFID